ncbi:MAG: radical SAM protein [Desulfarculaceae bacterium]|nr:radical SAM protein [Desulfarculaceae bacterium]MCF8071907.1 radical SAM protein [Desulfarculaceae bacterium]MCF8103707.1 radical SAM protein [Desulfarculaceae bacterium]MCF8114974.1 radical SAM protein [Desulfarculaceae bacterium]
MGLPCVFVRLSGCPLDCAWCDTAYAKAPGEMMSLPEITKKVERHGVGLVEITGGEPLVQLAAPELMAGLSEQGYTVLLETSGAISIAPVPEAVHVIMDIKCPSSGMAERMHWPNLSLLREHHQIKFVLAGREDYDYARAIIERHGLSQRAQVLISCVHRAVDPAQVAGWMLADRLEARFQMPLHKQLWPDKDRGV